MSRVELVPIDLAQQARLLPDLEQRLRYRFGDEVEQRRVWFDVEESFDASRGQYNSRRILEQLLSHDLDPSTKVLGVTSVDLFVPVLTFVFGEAQLGGNASLVSTCRLDNAVYGLPPSESLLLERLEKEATHELGHTYGLVHCHRLECVMHSSTYVEEIDLKTAAFCSECSARVENARQLGNSG